MALPDLDPEDAVALVRAARMHQEAVWLAEAEPSMAWLLLITAIELIANRSDKSQSDPVEKLAQSQPDLVRELQAAAPGAIAIVAKHLADKLGSTKKFVQFVVRFLPPPPDNRPPAEFQIKWSRSSFKETARILYNHRSRALHDGIPFPLPLCIAPFGAFGDWEAPPEKPIGLAMSGLGGSWLLTDTPIFLHVFEYVVRGAILGWFASLQAPHD